MGFIKKILLFAPSAILCACSSSVETAGSTTETENAIASGSVVVQVFDGASKAQRAAFKVLPSWYVTDTTGIIEDDDYVYIGTADENGKITIEDHAEGSYTMQIDKGDSSIVLQYTLNKLTQDYMVDSVSLQAKGGVKGWISLAKGEKYSWVHVPGLGRVQKTDSLGQFTMTGLPSGDISLKAWEQGTNNCVAQTFVTVTPKETIDVGHIEAPDEFVFKKTQKVNPRNLISSWMRPLSEPFVLVLRLDSTNFDFTQAQDDGNDFHLLDKDGKELPIEIDSWDATIQNAAINVRIEKLSDTLGVWTMEWGDIYEPAQEQADVWKGVKDSLMYELNSIEIFNFESGSTDNDLPSPLKREACYIQIHETDTLTDSVTTSTLLTALALQKDSTIRGGTVLHVNYTANYPDLMLVGTHLTDVPNDFSRMDSMVVWIKTDGDYEIILEHLEPHGKGINNKASYKSKGTSKWQRLSLKPEDFSYKIKDYHGWDITRNKITNFTVFGYNGTELWLDNVRIYGINRDDLKQ